MKQDNHGYVLGWILILMMVLSIFVLTAMAASASFYRRSLWEYDKRQAELTADSILLVVTSQLEENGSGAFSEIILEYVKEIEGENSSKETGRLPDITFYPEAGMGDGRMSGYYIPEDHRLILTAHVSKEEQTVHKSVILEKESLESEEGWTVLRYVDDWQEDQKGEDHEENQE